MLVLVTDKWPNNSVSQIRGDFLKAQPGLTVKDADKWKAQKYAGLIKLSSQRGFYS